MRESYNCMSVCTTKEVGKRTQMESNDIFKIIVEVYFGILLQNKNTTPGQPACQFALLPVSFFLFFQVIMSKILNSVQKSVFLIY